MVPTDYRVCEGSMHLCKEVSNAVLRIETNQISLWNISFSEMPYKQFIKRYQLVEPL